MYKGAASLGHAMVIDSYHKHKSLSILVEMVEHSINVDVKILSYSSCVKPLPL